MITQQSIRDKKKVRLILCSLLLLCAAIAPFLPRELDFANTGIAAVIFAYLACAEGSSNREFELRAEERIRELAESNRRLEAFAYTVSHDLQAPLRHIRGFGAVLQQRYAMILGSEGRRVLERIHAAVQRMDDLIEDLLALSTLTRKPLRLRDIDLSAMATEVIGGYAESDPERGVQFVAARGLTARVDCGLARIALENLLSNAWKFTGREQLARIEFGKGERGGRSMFFIRDNGVGFDMEHAAKLFVPFQRAHCESEFEGTGIGLATVQRIVHRHGGEVAIESAVSLGTTVWFDFGLEHIGDGVGPKSAAT